MQEVRATAAKHWTERVWYRHNQRWLQSSREGTEASKSGSFKDEQEWGKKCFEDLDQRRMGRPVTRTWSVEFKRTQDARSNYVERATAVAQEQYKSLLTGLQAVGQVKGWKM